MPHRLRLKTDGSLGTLFGVLIIIRILFSETPRLQFRLFVN